MFHVHKKEVLLLVLLFICSNIHAQTIDSNCVEDPDPFSNDRPLIDEIRKVYTDAAIKTWNHNNYLSVLAAIPNVKPIKGVKLKAIGIYGQEAIDWSRNGVIMKNVKLGIKRSRKEALKTIPTGGTILSEQDPIIEIVSFGYKKTNCAVVYYKKGYAGKAWAWNSLKYRKNDKVYELVYFYFGYLNFNVWSGGKFHCSWDGEIYLIADRSALIDKSCKSSFTYQVIRGNVDRKGLNK
ncbi:MAG: hypothetical protein HQK83_19250 [Fibrobacteria bacterium]|nr:hypothetical protein [Fibrobacteria bacterium]